MNKKLELTSDNLHSLIVCCDKMVEVRTILQRAFVLIAHKEQFNLIQGKDAVQAVLSTYDILYGDDRNDSNSYEGLTVFCARYADATNSQQYNQILYDIEKDIKGVDCSVRVMDNIYRQVQENQGVPLINENGVLEAYIDKITKSLNFLNNAIVELFETLAIFFTEPSGVLKETETFSWYKKELVKRVKIIDKIKSEGKFVTSYDDFHIEM